MPVALVSFYDETFKPLMDITLPHLEEYAARWGYQTYFGKPFENCSPRNGYDRYLCAYGLLQQGFDAVMWLDADAIITNHNIRIEDRIGDEKFVVANDLHGINAGVFIAANHVQTKELLLSMYNLGEELHGSHPFREQETMNRYLGYEHYKKMVTFLPQRMMNSFVNSYYNRPPEFSGNWRPGDWILHFAGISLENRCLVAPDFVAQIVK